MLRVANVWTASSTCPPSDKQTIQALGYEGDAARKMSNKVTARQRRNGQRTYLLPTKVPNWVEDLLVEWLETVPADLARSAGLGGAPPHPGAVVCLLSPANVLGRLKAEAAAGGDKDMGWTKGKPDKKVQEVLRRYMMTIQENLSIETDLSTQAGASTSAPAKR